MTRPVLAWIEAHHDCRLNDDTRAVVRALLTAAPCVDAGAAMEAIGMSYGTARWRLDKKRLPPPSAWRRLSRGLAIVRAVRRSGGSESQRLIAAALGCSDRTALHHATRRAFGVPLARARRMRPSALLARWYEREVGVHV